MSLFAVLVVAHSCVQSDGAVLQSNNIDDCGQFWHPSIDQLPKSLIVIDDIANSRYNNNSIELVDHNSGLQTHLLAQSLAGIINRYIKHNRGDRAVWFKTQSGHKSYERALRALSEKGVDISAEPISVYEVLNDTSINSMIDGYILTDVVNNPESATYAAVASHVHNAIVVDVRDVDYLLGYRAAKSFKLLCDARKKTTLDAWREFKDQCDNSALVVMPVQTAQLREFAIANNLFVFNLNKQQADATKGQNTELFEEILQWLEPNSPIYGWESGVNEDVFVDKISRYGHMMIPADWLYNTTVTSLDYRSSQGSIRLEDSTIEWSDINDDASKVVSFYLSDGDNIQWMMNNFESKEYLLNSFSEQVKMGYGIAASNLSMISPSQLEALFFSASDGSSLVETFGGGYYYVDTFGQERSRDESLKRISSRVAAHMKQNNIKLLALIAKDANSQSAQQAYREYVMANSELEGIIVTQYAPYAGGEGNIMWFKNSEGVDIPVITISYSVWNFGDVNHQREGSPAYIAQLINEDSTESPFYLTSVHAWSSFADIGDSNDLTLESTSPNRNVVGASAAYQVAKRLDESTKVVSIEELVWRVRAHYHPKQTEEILKNR